MCVLKSGLYLSVKVQPMTPWVGEDVSILLEGLLRPSRNV